VTNETCFLLLFYPPHHHTNNNEARPGVKSFFVSSLFFFFNWKIFFVFFLFLWLLDWTCWALSIRLVYDSILRIVWLFVQPPWRVLLHTQYIFKKEYFINKNDGYYFDRLSIRWFRALVIHARQTLILPTKDDEEDSFYYLRLIKMWAVFLYILDGAQTGSI
jgi:hypothetical protein